MTSRLNGQQSVDSAVKGYRNSGTKGAQFVGSAYKRGRVRLSKEDRARQLILQHGGRNVTAAIRIISSQLEQQRAYLSKESRSKELDKCACACHQQPATSPRVSTAELVGHSRSSSDISKDGLKKSARNQDEQQSAG